MFEFDLQPLSLCLYNLLLRWTYEAQIKPYFTFPQSVFQQTILTVRAHIGWA